MVDLTFDGLTQFLVKNGYAPSLQKETSQLLIVLKADKREYPLFLRILGGQKFLQMIVFLPPKVTKKTLPEVARILHLFNKEVDLPGFGLDEISMVAFYRLVLPAPDGKIDPALLLHYLDAAKAACASFSPAVENIASGAKTVDDVLRIAEQKMKQTE